MALGTPTIGTISYNATNLTPSYPAGVAANDILILAVGYKPSALEYSTAPPSGWTGLAAYEAGGYDGVVNIDTGNTGLSLLYKNQVLGTETGTVSVALTGISVAWAVIIRIPTTFGPDFSEGLSPLSEIDFINATPATPYTFTPFGSPQDIEWQANDITLYGFCIPTDVQVGQFSGHSVADASGLLTFSAATEITEFNSNLGFDIGGFLAFARVTAATTQQFLSPDVTYTTSIAGTLTNVRGPFVVVRIREGQQNRTLNPPPFFNFSIPGITPHVGVTSSVRPVTEIAETFEAPLTSSMWNLPGAGEITISGGRAQFKTFVSGVNDVSEIRSTNLYYFPDGAFVALRFYPPATPLTSIMSLRFLPPDAPIALALGCSISNDGVNDVVNFFGQSVTLNRTTHAWLRIRRDGQTMRLDAAPEAAANTPGTWTTLLSESIATPDYEWVLGTGKLGAYLYLAFTDSSGLPTTAEFDNLLGGSAARTLGTRYARPSDDISNIYWRSSIEATQPLALALDEAVADDGDFISTEVTDVAEIRLSAVPDPNSSSGQALRYRVRSLDGSGIVARLKQGSTVIATRTHTGLTSTWTTFEMVLSAAEADAITDYSDLRIELEAVQ